MKTTLIMWEMRLRQPLHWLLWRKGARTRQLLREHYVDRVEITEHDLTIYFKDSPEPFPLNSLAETSVAKRAIRKRFGHF